jgi:ATP-dependent Clp protease protease subunit
MRKFWNWVTSADGGRTLYLDGAISNDTWWGDDVTPTIFKEELGATSGDVTIWINSPGGDVFAGAQIYNMLKEYPGKITVKIDGCAASIASVIAMAGDEVLMSPVSTIIIHNPETFAWGDEKEMKRVKDMLGEIKEAIINAYEMKTKLPRTRISELMDDESCMNVKTAMELGFADGMLYGAESTLSNNPVMNSVLFSKKALANSFIKKFSAQASAVPTENNKNVPPEKPSGVHISSLYQRLFLLNKMEVV